MNKIFNEIINYISPLGIVLIIVGSFISEDHIAVLNIGFLLLIVCAIAYKLIGINLDINTYKYTIICFASIALIFFISALLHSYSFTNSFGALKHKALWFIIPFLFITLPYYKSLFNLKVSLWVYVITVFIITTIAFYHYARDGIFNNYLNYPWSNYFHVSTIPFRISHHTLSIANNISFTFLIYMLLNKYYLNNWEKIIIICIVIFNVFYIHLIGARVGHISFYILIICFVIYLLSDKDKKYFKIVTASLVLLLLLCTLSYCYINGFRSRINQTIVELKVILTTHQITNNGNISLRIISIKNSIPVLKEYILKGTSFEKYETTMEYYKIQNKISDIDWAYPPNQFIVYSIIIGMPLTVLFFGCLLITAIYRFKDNILVTLGTYLPIILYLNTEAPLETNMPFRMIIVSISIACACKKYELLKLAD
ncbi:MAG: hypothetical protein NW207_08080 [Cytophagales bacterium]|nr:hypothetical protein [Cytophagales bacterium]